MAQPLVAGKFGQDSRIFPRVTQGGKFLRPWRSCSDDALRTDPPEHTEQLEGPTQAPTSLNKWSQSEIGVMGSLRQLISEGVFPDKCVHMYELMVSAAVIQLFSQVDQGDITQWVSMELLLRRFDMVVYIYQEAKRSGSRPDWSIADAFLGCPLASVGRTMTSLERQRWIATRLKDEAEIAKQREKAMKVRTGAADHPAKKKA